MSEFAKLDGIEKKTNEHFRRFSAQQCRMLDCSVSVCRWHETGSVKVVQGLHGFLPVLLNVVSEAVYVAGSTLYA